MSCFNCYSSRKIDAELVDKILDRGQRLRSAMVQAILSNDPFNQEVILQESKSVRLEDLNRDSNDKIRAFLQGDPLSREDEMRTLETLRSMSAVDLCRVTDRTYASEEPCDCLTCVEYTEKDLKCDLKRAETNEITKKIQERYKSEVNNHLKFVDCVKIGVNSVLLNEAGDKKVMDSLVKEKAAGVGQTFFLEYQIPEIFVKNHQRLKTKVDSGLEAGNVVRLCSRRTHGQAISFKQVSVHDVNLSKVKLDDAVITFRLSFRNFKQKQPVSLGVAKFSFSSFEVSKNFVCNQELTIRLSEKAPIVVGGLKVSIQLGCGRLYFGKEFFDAITTNKENSIVLGSDDLSGTDSELIEKVLDFYTPNVSVKTSFPRNTQKSKPDPSVPKLKLVPSKTELEPSTQKPISSHRMQSAKPESVYRAQKAHESPWPIESVSWYADPVAKPISGKKSAQKQIAQHPEPIGKPVIQTVKPVSGKCESLQKPVLFGFVYISEANFSREVLNSYLKCQLFALDDICRSKLVTFSCNPIYNFSQQLPLVCEEEFLLKLRENFMVVEFIEKGEKDFLIGLSKLPLHQFYLAYRNPIIVKYLSERRLPVIGTDGWESIYNPNDSEVVGQAQFLVALGTKEQIDNLENERGFNSATVTAKVPQISKTVDVGTQSMEPKKDIETFLEQLATQKSCTVESSRNPAPEVRSTSDLLDSLHKALSIDTTNENNTFKAHIAINGALHIPSRRKCKSRRSKGRNAKHEDILPSTYVTFEDFNGDLKITPVAPKSTSPKWEFKCDVSLPIEYLVDNQKFLVFKVWRKATNATATHNMQVDHVIGFAAVDLTVLAAGLPSVQGWFNINDLTKKCNGQINIHVTPSENVLRYHSHKSTSPLVAPPQPPEAPLEPGELLGRALKRKFTELDEITQRLRLRLSKVTNDESDASNDEIADEFERDINTLCVEDDFDTVDFEKEARSFNLQHVKEVGLLQADYLSGESKQKLDQMLEKLSLMSGEASSRYVSGCSDARFDTETLLCELDSTSRPNLHSSASFSREMAQKFSCLLDSVVQEGRSEGEGSDAKSTD